MLNDHCCTVVTAMMTTLMNDYDFIPVSDSFLGHQGL